MLVVSRGNVMSAVEPSGTRPPEVFVHDTQHGLAAQILEALELPILVSDPVDGNQIANLSRPSMASAFAGHPR